MHYIFAVWLKSSPFLDRTKAITWIVTHCTSVEGEEILDKDIQIDSCSDLKCQGFFHIKARKPGLKR